MNQSSTIQAISNLLFLSANHQKSDLIFVFGSSYISTMDAVKKLFDQRFSEKILITGHSKGRLKNIEADRFYKRGIELGIPKECFILEKKAWQVPRILDI